MLIFCRAVLIRSVGVGAGSSNSRGGSRVDFMQRSLVPGWSVVLDFTEKKAPELHLGIGQETGGEEVGPALVEESAPEVTEGDGGSDSGVSPEPGSFPGSRPRPVSLMMAFVS